MKCNYKRKKLKYFDVTDIEPFDIKIKEKTSGSIDLNKYLYHAIGTYLPQKQRVNRLKAIIDSGAILSENLQNDIFELSNSFSQSPKCNGQSHISICQRESFVKEKEVSESYKLFVNNGISIILDKDLCEDLEVENKFNPSDVWEWLDGEYRVKDKISSTYFKGIGIPNRTFEETVQALKDLGNMSLEDCASNIINSDWFKDFCDIKSCMEHRGNGLPIYSIVSGKEMGDLITALSSVFKITPDEAEVVCYNLQQRNADFGIPRKRTTFEWKPAEFDDFIK